MPFYYCESDTEHAIIEADKHPFDTQRPKWSSGSIPYPSREALIKGEQILDEPCRKCGKLVRTHYVEECKKRLIARNLCFTCDFWTEYVEKKDDPHVARINGKHWWVNPIDNSGGSGQFRGMGGRRFRIRWKDGREQDTNDLWHQGEIPERFRDELPDNAEFVEEPNPIGHGQGFLA